ncbi:MAG: FHA domain-containing protein [Verrucomicrobia bacterium]|nr:FHA domain-containing protein [Verrucomicrobiota bacterium]
MARLILLHESGVTGEFPLQPGVNTVGRSPDNDLSVDDASVSDHHCEIELTASGVVVRDLGSAQGTWIDAARIQEGRLDAGQTLLVGEVPFALQVPLRVDVATPGASPGQTLSGPAGTAAASADPVHCPSCGRWWAPSATRQQRAGLAVVHFCPQCGRPCAGPAAALSPDPGDRPPKTFGRRVVDAFAYPLRGSGVGMLVSGTLALLLAQYAAWLASHAFLLGLLALVILTVGVVGYFFAFLKQVVVTSASGAGTLPGWPDILSPAEFVEPFLHFLALMAVSFGPWLLWRMWGPEVGGGWIPWVLVGWGFFTVPWLWSDSPWRIPSRA